MEELRRRFDDVFGRGDMLGTSVWQWAVFIALTTGLFLLLLIVVGVVRPWLKQRAKQTDHRYDDYILLVLKHTWTLSYLALACFVALHFVDLKPDPEATDQVGRTIRTVALVVIFLQIGRWGMSVIDLALQQGFRFANFTETAAKTAFGVVRFFALVAIWTSVAILILSTFGIEITPLVAGLGIGGIAVGFALQQILGDIFCSVAIVLDRPFEVGDFIITGDHMGSIEHIGVKTTRVRSLGGEQIIFPNSDLIGSRVRNYKRMAERRVTFGFGVLYATSAEKLERLPEIVREIIEAQAQTRFDRAHFASFGDSSLDFEVVYHVLSPDYNLYMDIQQQINLSLFRRLEEIGIGFAFPSRTLYVEGTKAPLRTHVLLTDGNRPKTVGGES
ncbi:mechanosensitive ion channel family protein [soil metagenome]